MTSDEVRMGVCEDSPSLQDGLPHTLDVLHVLQLRSEYLLSTLHGCCTLSEAWVGCLSWGGGDFFWVKRWRVGCRQMGRGG